MMNSPCELWTIKELADWLRVSTWAVRAMLKRRQIPYEAIIKIGRRVRIRVDIVHNWSQRNQTR